MNFRELDLQTGLIWASIWVLIVLVLGNSTFWNAIMSGISFMMIWVLISIILLFLCKNYNLCLKKN